jgi:hypothetical protein
MFTIKRTGAADYGRFIKLLVCGDPGAGKTLISSTFPNPLYASAEGGLMSIADRNIPYVEIRNMNTLLKLKNTLDQTPEVRQAQLGFPVDTLVIDTIDEVQRIMIRERLEKERKESMTLPDWGYIGEQMQALIRGLRNLDLNVVFTCHLGTETDGESGRVVYKAGLQGATSGFIPSAVDLSLLLKAVSKTEIIGDKAEKVTVRYLQTVPDLNHPWIKDRSGKLPGEFMVNFQDDYQRISDLIFAHVGDLESHADVDVAGAEVPTLDEPQTVVESTVSKPAPTNAAAARARVQAAAKPAPAPAPEPTPEPAPVVEEVVEAPAPTPPANVNEDGEVVGVQSRNKLPEGVEAKPNGSGTNYFCEICGDEVESDERADIAKIRFRKIVCVPHFNELKRANIKGAK